MVDETTDESNKEQMVVCFRWVDNQFVVHEDFVGLYHLDSTDAHTIVTMIKDVLVRMNLSMHRVRGQCYDGASNMSGHRSGVAARIKVDEPKAIYTHCYGHALNLSCSDAIQGCKVMQNALDTTRQITQLVKGSTKRDTVFRHIKENLTPDAPGIRVLCPTRWTVRAEAFQSVLLNMESLTQLCEETIETLKDSKTRTLVRGVFHQMMEFDYFFGASLGHLLLSHADNLSKALQNSTISAAEGQETAKKTVQTLQSMRTDSHFEEFWRSTTRAADKAGVSEPTMPRRRKIPRRLDEGTAAAEFPESVPDLFRQVYFEALDLLVTCIQERFNQEDYATYRQLEDLLLDTVNGGDGENLQFVRDFYSSDIDGSRLQTQLQVLATTFPRESSVDVSFADILQYFRQLPQSGKVLLSEVCKVLKLILVMPATNATSERTFSALRRVKSYLRTTMTQSRLNHLMLLHIHKEKTDDLDLIEVANEFVQHSEHRLSLFGKFVSSDL